MAKIETKQPGDRLTARFMNRLNDGAERASRIRANQHGMSLSGTRFDSLPAWTQRMVEIVSRLNDETFRVKVRYYSFADSQWKSLPKQWDLDVSNLETTEDDDGTLSHGSLGLSAGDKIPAYWDRSIGKFVPIGGSGQQRCRAFAVYTAGGDQLPVNEAESEVGEEHIWWECGLILSDTGVDNWRLINGRTYRAVGKQHRTVTGFSTFPVEKQSFVNLVFLHNVIIFEAGIAYIFTVDRAFLYLEAICEGGEHMNVFATSGIEATHRKMIFDVPTEVETGNGRPDFDWSDNNPRGVVITPPDGETWTISARFGVRLLAVETAAGSWSDSSSWDDARAWIE